MKSKIETQINQLNTPVLFLVFNRLETTKQVFEAIRQAKPTKLYVGADGARLHKVDEVEKTKLVREYVLGNIDWPCEVFTLFRDQNLGCKYAVSGAINWFFENEEMGIILEDDVLPDMSFFRYCEELLIKYKDVSDIKMISGTCYAPHLINGSNSYLFNRYANIWGWATWKRAWNSYDPELVSWPDIKNTNFLLETGNFYNDFKRYWTKMLDNTYRGIINTWDYQWQYTIWLNKGICISPTVNLIENIGFDDNSTHAFDSQHISTLLKKHCLQFPLIHPKQVVVNKLVDRWQELHILNTNPSLKQRIRYQLSKYFKKAISFIEKVNSSK
jgi:hypothetical protein